VELAANSNAGVPRRRARRPEPRGTISGVRLRPLSRRTRPFIESVIREMTRLGAEVGGVNLAQGLPDFEPPAELVEALRRATRAPGAHQYSFTWGSPEFRTAIAEKYRRFNGLDADPDREITVTCGVSEAIVASVFALTEPGDEVVILEPWYENYVPACVLAGVTPRFVPLSPRDFSLDLGRLAAAIGKKTRLLLLNTPGNPSGRVLGSAELEGIAALCVRHGLIAVVDEIYEHLYFDGHRHVSLATIPGMRDRTVTLSGLGKSYAVTGWRVGWAVAAPALTALVRKVHDYLTVCAPALEQEAGRTALVLPDAYYDAMRATYARRRRKLLGSLSKAGFGFTPPEGAYYVMADVAPLGWKDDWKFLDFLARKVGVIAVPGSSFYRKGRGRTKLRFNFAKKDETLEAAAGLLSGWDLRYPGTLLRSSRRAAKRA
jgi:aminotransferase